MEKNKFIEELFYELSCQLGKEFEMKQKRVWTMPFIPSV